MSTLNPSKPYVDPDVSPDVRGDSHKSVRCEVCGKVPRDRATQAAEVLALLNTSPGGFA